MKDKGLPRMPRTMPMPNVKPPRNLVKKIMDLEEEIEGLKSQLKESQLEVDRLSIKLARSRHQAVSSIPDLYGR